MAVPSAAFQSAILASHTRVTSRIEIYEADAVTPWLSVDDKRLISGNVTVDYSRTERRALECVLDDTDGKLKSYPQGFWYDKVIKPYRGVITSFGQWETQLGEFQIDRGVSPHFPNTISITCRDYTKRCLNSKFGRATAFSSGTPIESVIRTIGTNAGLTKFILPVTGFTLTSDFYLEPGTERWKAMIDIANAYGYDLYFNTEGFLVMQEFADPALGPSVFSLRTGPGVGNLASFEKATNDDRIYNYIQVTGDNNGVPVYAEAQNVDPSSPTRIAKLGERVYRFTSTFMNTVEQCQDVADKFLKVHALEEFDLSFSSIVLPWLDAGQVIEFIDPDPSPGDPTKFLLSSINIPLTLGAMSGTGKRVRLLT